MPYLAGGAALVMFSVLVFGAIATRLDDRTLVLAVRVPVAAGQVIAESDVQAVPAANATGLGLIPARSKSSVVGRVAAWPLRPGVLLVASLIGEPAFPPPGQRLVSVNLKLGQYPQHLAAGARVEVYLDTPATGVGAAGMAGTTTVPTRVVAQVVEVDTATVAADGSSGAVVTLLLAADVAMRLAGSSPGSLLLMQMPAGE